MESDIESIKVQDTRQNELLDKHILGVQTNTQRLELEIKQRKDLEMNLRMKQKEASNRIAELEAFPKFKEQLLKYTKSAALWLSAVGGAILLLDKFFNFM
jgi:peptidoglycan hydrolase CwlO-like protein